MNGIASHGVFVPICGTFLNFLTYGYAAVRLAALDQLKTIYILSHDSIQLGEDGPTHQPVEVLATLRATPGIVSLRPCDGRETRAALWVALLERWPVAILLTRQKVSEIDETKVNCGEKDGRKAYALGVEKGAYYLSCVDNHEIILLASGSEVELAFETRKILKEYRVSIISFVSFELFERQSEEYKRGILDRKAVKVSIEAFTTFGWAKYSDYQIGLDEFGRSATGKEVYKFFGFTPNKIAERIKGFIKN